MGIIITPRMENITLYETDTKTLATFILSHFPDSEMERWKDKEMEFLLREVRGSRLFVSEDEIRWECKATGRFLALEEWLRTYPQDNIHGTELARALRMASPSSDEYRKIAQHMAQLGWGGTKTASGMLYSRNSPSHGTEIQKALDAAILTEIPPPESDPSAGKGPIVFVRLDLPPGYEGGLPWEFDVIHMPFVKGFTVEGTVMKVDRKSVLVRVVHPHSDLLVQHYGPSTRFYIPMKADMFGGIPLFARKTPACPVGSP